MGEKLLAQRVLRLLRDTNASDGRAVRALLDWAADRRGWLWPDRRWAEAAPGRRRRARAGDTIDWESLPLLAEAIDTDEPDSILLGSVDAISDLLELDPFERDVLRVAACFERLPHLAALRQRLLACGEDMVALAGRLAGADFADGARRVRRCGAVSLGLLVTRSDAGFGGLDLILHWRLANLLDEGIADDMKLIEALAGIRQQATLAPADFVEHGQAFDLLRRMLGGALERNAAGINVLIYGPPGTGKTELARTLAAELGVSLFAVGECGDEGDEPSRYDRLHALQRAQRLLARRGDSLLLFDEMEDLFAEARLSSGGGRRAGSKIFVNRLLEANRVPTIWTSNAIWDIDRAHLRRLSYVLHMDLPSTRARARIAARAAEAEGAAEAARGLDPLLAQEGEAASVARVALRGAALAGGGAGDAEAVGRSLLLGLRGGRPLPPGVGGGALDLALYECEPPVESLVERLAAPGAAGDVSLLLTGPPGTGKTALAAHVAERLDRPLTVKRASDLLSKWIGGTEANIAEAFAAARDEGSVLLLDEVDSLLLDRSDAQRSWEITQVNELLTWMDSHPLPFIAATNWARRLDPAALRRFVFKIELAPLSGESVERAWARFFDIASPAGLRGLAGLTPGDFALVARQLRHAPAAGPDELLARLEAELRAKPERALKIGF